MLDILDLSNPYICAAVLIICLFFILVIFIRSPKKGSSITQSLVYFGIILVFVLDLHNTRLKNKYLTGANDKDIDNVMQIARGANDQRFVSQIYDI